MAMRMAVAAAVVVVFCAAEGGARLCGEAGGVCAVHKHDGAAAGGLLRVDQGRRPERPQVPLRALRHAGDLQGLQHQRHPSPRRRQALRPQRHHRSLQE